MRVGIKTGSEKGYHTDSREKYFDRCSADDSPLHKEREFYQGLATKRRTRDRSFGILLLWPVVSKKEPEHNRPAATTNTPVYAHMCFAFSSPLSKKTIRFHEDEATKWTFDSAFSVGNKSTGPFGVPANVLAVSCPGGCRCVQ